MDHDQKRELIEFVVQNLQVEIDKCNKIYRETKQANDILTAELERYKGLVKHFERYMKKVELEIDYT